EQRRQFVLEFQRLTAAAMRDGARRATCRYYPLLACNDTGGQPDRLGLSPEEFHRENQNRLDGRRRVLLSTGTSDGTLGEDFRARLAVLPEITGKWIRAVGRWRSHNQMIRQNLGDYEAPDRAEEYLIYQTIVGAWPNGGVQNDRDLV